MYILAITMVVLSKFDRERKFVLKWGNSESEAARRADRYAGCSTDPGKFSSGAPIGIAIDSENNVWATDRHRVQKFDSTGTFLLQFGSFGAGESQFRTPHGIAVDSGDNVYVVDRYNSRIQKFDSNGNYILSWDTVWGKPFGIV